ncbi:hypothetical protein TOTORO_02470 [Serratia phage vB_SmaS-Totoro]|nr:hypothetical protein TOTORO_02470 [Serratia phage vB_SmaS-Totoro]
MSEIPSAILENLILRRQLKRQLRDAINNRNPDDVYTVTKRQFVINDSGKTEMVERKVQTTRKEEELRLKIDNLKAEINRPAAGTMDIISSALYGAMHSENSPTGSSLTKDLRIIGAAAGKDKSRLFPIFDEAPFISGKTNPQVKNDLLSRLIRRRVSKGNSK